MKKRILGSNQASLEVSALGLGCMGMSHQYGKAEEKDSLAVLNRALELGVNFFDSSDSYELSSYHLAIAYPLTTSNLANASLYISQADL